MSPKLLFFTLASYLFLASIILFPHSVSAQSSLSITNINQSATSVPLYDKLEISFNVTGSNATNPQFPYDPQSVTGLTTGNGITVDGLFLPPGQSNWQNAIVYPAFLYQPTLVDLSYGTVRADWVYPSGNPYWLLRFAPKITGTWQYRLRVQDASNYPNWLTSSTTGTFSVTSARPGINGFIQIAQNDKRYFEFTNGATFPGVGHQMDAPGIQSGQTQFASLKNDKLNFMRLWMSSALVWARGTHGWNAWRDADYHKSVEEKFGASDFSLKFPGSRGATYIFQTSDGNQHITSSFEAGKTYKVRIRAKFVNASPSNFQVKLIDNPVDWSTTRKTLAPNTSWNIIQSGSNGWNLYESSFVNDQGRFISMYGRVLAMGLNGGGTAYIDELYIGEDTGTNQIGPNVVFKGKANYQYYFDPIASGVWDGIISSAEINGIYLKPVINDKEDAILTRFRLSDGVYDPSQSHQTWSAFHSEKNKKVRRLHEYFWRYLAARWGYSRAIHSWELVNEGDPNNTYHRDQANHMGELIHKFTNNNHLATTSFWAGFPASSFWGNSAYQHLDYVDYHAYNSTGWMDNQVPDPALLEKDAAYYHLVYSQDTRRLLTQYRNMPIVRGEAGIDFISGPQEEIAAMRNDTYGVWLHNFTWAMLSHHGSYELYWWADRSLGLNPGPDGSVTNGLREIFAPYVDFMANIPVANGRYQNASPTASASNVRVVGQKNNLNQTATHAHLWIQNSNHIWRNVVDGVSYGSLSGTVTLGGFAANTSYPAEWWDFNTRGVLRSRNTTLSSNSSGVITLSLNSLPTINSLPVTDTAVKIGNYTNIPTPPPISPTPFASPTPTGPGGPTPTPGPSPTPFPGGVISNLIKYDGYDWQVRTNLQVGNEQYTDRSFTLSSLPSHLLGAPWISTANSSRSFTGEIQATFVLSQSATVYVAHNDAIFTRPSWLSSQNGWTQTSQSLTNSEPRTFTLFSQSFPQGSTVSLGQNNDTGASMYTIIVIPSTPTYSLDNDNDIDIYDILILISRFTQNLIGDFNGNGRIDIFDFNTLLRNRL
jgi:hypothetical protein